MYLRRSVVSEEGCRGRGDSRCFLFPPAMAVDRDLWVRNMTKWRVNYTHTDMVPTGLLASSGDITCGDKEKPGRKGYYCFLAVFLAQPLPPAEIWPSAFSLGPQQLPSTYSRDWKSFQRKTMKFTSLFLTHVKILVGAVQSVRGTIACVWKTANVCWGCGQTFNPEKERDDLYSTCQPSFTLEFLRHWQPALDSANRRLMMIKWENHLKDNTRDFLVKQPIQGNRELIHPCPQNFPIVPSVLYS